MRSRAWAHRTVLALRGGPRRPGATPDGLAAVAAAAAIRADLAAEIDVLVRDDGLVMLPSLGAASLNTGAGPQAGVATGGITAHHVEVVAADVRVVIPANYHDHAPGWRPLSPVLTDPFELVVDDVDPFRMPSPPQIG